MNCRVCGQANREQARFCDNCGGPLELPAAATEERKLVTIIFADVVASTELVGRVDPERVRAQMARFFTIAREEIERFGGTLEKFIGDAVQRKVFHGRVLRQGGDDLTPFLRLLLHKSVVEVPHALQIGHHEPPAQVHLFAPHVRRVEDDRDLVVGIDLVGALNEDADPRLEDLRPEG